MTILIVATSGRMLAQSAKRAGLAPIVIDLFGDRDTRELALEVQTVAALTQTALAPALDALMARFDIQQAAYGSGLELHPASLDYLNSRLPVYGNSPLTCKRLQDKRAFFELLKNSTICYPEVSFEPPVTTGDWLTKPYLGDGGAGIFFYHPELAAYDLQYRGDDSAEEQTYWQQYQHGEPMSVLFLADSRRARIIGFNRQWTAAAGRCPFAFAGVMNNAELPKAAKRQLERWLQTLTAAYSLLGLNSLDFIWDGRQAWILEINPRPSASMALYDDAFENGLLAAHLAACQGALPATAISPAAHTAYQILHAPDDCRIPEANSWPDWTHDRPHDGSLIRAGHPICSIMARANTPRRTVAQLRARRRIIFNTLNSKIET